MQTISDAELVAECRQGNKDAFGFLVDKYKGAVYALAYHRVRNAADAEDIAQEAFLLAYRRLPSLRNPHCFAGWLYTTTVHCAISWLRKRARSDQHMECLEHKDSPGLISVAEEAFRHRQLQESIQDAIETLADSQRLPILLHYLGGLSTKETAQFLGISHGSVRVRLHRARQQLRKEFIEMPEPIPAVLRLDAEFTIRLMERLQSLRFHKPIPVMPPVTIISASLLSLLFLVASLIGLPHWMNLSPAQFGVNKPIQVELMAAEVSAQEQNAQLSTEMPTPSPDASAAVLQFSDL